MKPRLSSDLIFTGMVLLVSLAAAFAFETSEIDLTRTEATLSLSDLVPCCQEETPKPRGVYRFAVAPLLTPSAVVTGFPAFSRYLSQRLGKPFDTVNCRTFAEIDVQLRLGEASVALVGSGPYVLGRRQYGLVPIAVPVVRGQTTERTYLVVQVGSPVRAWADLRGRSIAFSDSLASSGRLIPVAALAKLGEAPDGFFRKVVYTQGLGRSLRAVAAGLVDAASVDSLHFESAVRQDPRLRKGLRVVWQSAAFGNGPVVVNSQMPAGFRRLLASTLFGMRSDPAGRRVLAGLELDGFEPADPAQYQALEAMLLPPGAAL